MAGSSAGSVFVDLLLKDAKYQDGLRKARTSTKQATSEMRQGFEFLSGAIVGVASALTAGLTFNRFIQNTIKAQKEQAQLAAVLRSTGQAAQYSVAQLNKMSLDMQQNSIFSSGEITNAQTRLLSYSGLLSENFPRAMQIVIDQSARLNMSLEQSAETIGRALESPSKAAAALSRQGFGAAFTKEVQTMIKSLEEQGRAAEAQQVVMEILEDSYKGAAEAAGNTLGGAITQLNNAIDSVLVADGGFPALQNALKGTADFLVEASKQSNLFESAMYKVGQALLGYYIAWQQMASAVAQKSNFFGLRDEDVRKYEENIDKAIKAYDRMQSDLDRNNAAGAVAGLPTGGSNLLGGGTGGYTTNETAEKRIKELNSLYNQHRGLIQGVDSATLKYRDTIEDLNKLLETGKITQEEYNGAVYRAQEEFDKAREKGTQFAFDVEAATKRAAENIQDSFADFLFDPFDKGLKGMLKGFVDTIRRMVAEAQSAQILGALFGNNSNSGFGQLLGSLTGSTGSSGIKWDQPFSFGSFGGLFDGFFADGGYISPGHFGVAGEAGAELIYGGKTGATVFNQDQVGRGNVYNIDARGADQAAITRLEQSLLTLAGPGVIEQRVGNAQMRGAL